ncbi:hypothetical protein RJ640_014451 [Escallonia rubra]|uniref:Uncharacterized protein n=1 Tax=Escallonia rubra TaxID=112253 RepID=A0AA88U8D8_9ASTE|nr:hypothetical protein RJ640_014451 [Escallonia rubra]
MAIEQVEFLSVRQRRDFFRVLVRIQLDDPLIPDQKLDELDSALLGTVSSLPILVRSDSDSTNSRDSRKREREEAMELIRPGHPLKRARSSDSVASPVMGSDVAAAGGWQALWWLTVVVGGSRTVAKACRADYSISEQRTKRKEESGPPCRRPQVGRNLGVGAQGNKFRHDSIPGKINVKILRYAPRKQKPVTRRLVDLLNLGTSAASTSRGSSIIFHRTIFTTCTLVHLCDDGVADALQLLHLVFKLIRLRKLVGIQPLDGRLDGILHLLLVSRGKLGSNLLVLHCVPHVVRVVLQSILRLDLLLVLFILRLVLLCLLNHLLDLILGKSTLVIGDGDLVLLSGSLVLCRHIKDTIGINIEANCDLGNTPGSWRNSRELEFPEQVVVPGPGPLTLVHLNQDTRLVVRVGREHLLLLGGDCGVSLDQSSHNTTSSFQTKGERGDIQKEEILNLLVTFTTQDSSLDSSTISHSLVRVDALAELLPIEEVLQ